MDQRTLSKAEQIRARAIAAAESFARNLVEQFEDRAGQSWDQSFDASGMPRFPGSDKIVCDALRRDGFVVTYYEGDQRNEPSIRMTIKV